MFGIDNFPIERKAESHIRLYEGNRVALKTKYYKKKDRFGMQQSVWASLSPFSKGVFLQVHQAKSVHQNNKITY